MKYLLLGVIAATILTITAVVAYNLGQGRILPEEKTAIRPSVPVSLPVDQAPAAGREAAEPARDEVGLDLEPEAIGREIGTPVTKPSTTTTETAAAPPPALTPEPTSLTPDMLATPPSQSVKRRMKTPPPPDSEGAKEARSIGVTGHFGAMGSDGNNAVATTTDDRDLGPGADREHLPKHGGTWGLPERPLTSIERRIHGIDNPFKRVAAGDHTSTFSIDVDTAAYGMVQRDLRAGRLPQPESVRIEELINAFSYNYRAPSWGSRDPFSAGIDAMVCPWNQHHLLARIAIQGQRVAAAERPPSNLVFLIDTSGSMRANDRMPLLKQALHLLVDRLDTRDRICLVTYANDARIALDTTTGDRKQFINDAITRLHPSGSTNGGAGLRLAYAQARGTFIEGGVNRVILATDGEFNTGRTEANDLATLIRSSVNDGIYLSTLGFGRGFDDKRLEELSNDGNGFYSYVDSYTTARRVFGEQLTSQLVTIAKDAKVQVFFNPDKVAGFRLIGYENRRLAHHEFANDAVDAGEIGAGHSVTALYEIVPKGAPVPRQNPVNPFVQPLVEETPISGIGDRNHVMVRLRHKHPEGSTSRLQEFKAELSPVTFAEADTDFRWAAAIAAAGMQLRHSPYRGTADWHQILAWAGAARGEDINGARAEFLNLLRNASGLKRHH